MIYVIGDSHAQFFTDLKPGEWQERGQFRAIWTTDSAKRSPTAYGLVNPDSKSGGRKWLFRALATVPTGSTVLLSYGEIDCRAHIVKESHLSLHDPIYHAWASALNYARVIEEIERDFGYDVWALAPPPVSADGTRWTEGAHWERARAREAFIQALQAQGVRVVSPMDLMLDEDDVHIDRVFQDELSKKVYERLTSR